MSEPPKPARKCSSIALGRGRMDRYSWEKDQKTYHMIWSKSRTA